MFVWERDFSDVIKVVHNKQLISFTQLSGQCKGIMQNVRRCIIFFTIVIIHI